MIYITGDVHGNVDRLFQSDLTENDYLIVLGDFGCIWETDRSDEYKLNYLSELPYKILFLDGNHENFYRLKNDFAVEKWNGGLIHKVRKNVYHLMRAQKFEIEGKTFFVMGGATSIDKEIRTENKTWWKEEIPTDDEWDCARKNFVGYADYILTHCLPTSVVKKFIFPELEKDAVGDKMEWMINLDYNKWYFGHYHFDLSFDKFRGLYGRIESL